MAAGCEDRGGWDGMQCQGREDGGAGDDAAQDWAAGDDAAGDGAAGDDASGDGAAGDHAAGDGAADYGSAEAPTEATADCSAPRPTLSPLSVVPTPLIRRHAAYLST
ncbi:unnamed protein product [Closterium sp. Yama58-4]|nr:unnamed protein product [Closterium sp. Yama58-4]